MNMSHLDKNIAVNLKRIRKSRNMSLDMLAEKTGVSKSMLGQIERGESNPTVATIAKIVDGIRVPFEDLIYPKTDMVTITDNAKLPVFKAKEGAYQVRAVFPYDRRRSFEVYEIRIEPGEFCDRIAPEQGMGEYIMVQKGALTLETDDGVYEVPSNHTITLEAGSSHKYHNKESRELVFTMLIAYADAAI